MLKVTHLVSAHYFEYSKHFAFTGEAHDFWEFLYVDKGQILVDAGHKRHLLTQGQLIVHEPNEWHTVFSDGRVAPNLIVMSFYAEGEALMLLKNQIFTTDMHVQKLLALLVQEMHLAFKDDLSDYRLTQLTPSADAPFASQQIIKLLIEQLIIVLLRYTISDASSPPITPIQLGDQREQLTRITQAIQALMPSKVTLTALSKCTALSISTMARCIKKSHNISVMTFVEQQKMEHVKDLMRLGNHHLDEIAHLTGYLSVSHLGRIFKKHMSMTLSEYARRLKR